MFAIGKAAAVRSGRTVSITTISRDVRRRGGDVSRGDNLYIYFIFIFIYFLYFKRNAMNRVFAYYIRRSVYPHVCVYMCESVFVHASLLDRTKTV